MPTDWKRTDDTAVTKVGFRTIVRKHFELPDGQVAPFDVIDHEGISCAAIIALTPEHKVVLAVQYRPGPERVMYELPGGGVEHGEDPEVGAKRELLEETGYQAGSITHVGSFYIGAYDNAIHHYYLATDCRLGAEQQLEATEFVEVQLCTIPELIAHAKAGHMTDTPAVFAAYDTLLALQ